jgi:hypothetical protein
MKLECSSFTCECEKPVEYCKKCSHAYWHVRGKTYFKPRFGGFTSVYYYKFYDQWLKDFENLDIKNAEFA